MNLIEELKALGVNTEEGIARFMDNPTLYEKFVKRYVSSAETIHVLEFIESGELETAKANCHNLKGVTGNLSLTPLYDGYSEIMALLRADDIAGAKEKLEALLPVQDAIVATLKKYL